MRQAVTRSDGSSRPTFRQVPQKLGMSETAGAISPPISERLFKASVTTSILFSLIAFAIGLSIYFLSDSGERHKRFLNVHFFQQGLLKPELLISGWSTTDTNGLGTIGNRSELRVPLKSDVGTDVNLTIDFSYVRSVLSTPTGQRVLRLFTNDSLNAEWTLSGAQSRTVTIKVPRDIAGNKETLKLTLQSIPRDPLKASDGVIYLHSIMVYYD